MTSNGSSQVPENNSVSGAEGAAGQQGSPHDSELSELERLNAMTPLEQRAHMRELALNELEDTVPGPEEGEVKTFACLMELLRLHMTKVCGEDETGNCNQRLAEGLELAKRPVEEFYSDSYTAEFRLGMMEAVFQELESVFREIMDTMQEGRRLM